MATKKQVKTLRLTQESLRVRIYRSMKKEWMSKNKEEKVLDSKFVNGTRYEKTSKNGDFHPFWQTKRFDPAVTISYYIKMKIKSDISFVKKYLHKGEYIIVNQQKIVK